MQRQFGFPVNFEVAKELLEENDGAGNTFKATAKPVLIGTAVVGATTMIFAIIMGLTQGLTVGHGEAVDPPPAVPARPHRRRLDDLLVHRRVDAGGHDRRLSRGRVHQGATSGSRASTKASVEDSRKVVEICTQYAQKGMFNIFLGVFFSTLAFAFIEPFFFIGYLISIALFGLFQAIFMANAGGAWDNAKKIVETELKMKGTDLHAASVVGDTVGDPFKDTSSVAMNPVIKFTTLFGVLAVELGIYLAGGTEGSALTAVLAAVFFVDRHGRSCIDRSTGCGSRRKSARQGSIRHQEQSSAEHRRSASELGDPALIGDRGLATDRIALSSEPGALIRA